ncbi:MAG: GNAT family N-acetyltransferase [Gemmataceae bacterium]|nr:GNAT family N-acetyltransferase [Gemmataceae bacterium]
MITIRPALPTERPAAIALLFGDAQARERWSAVSELITSGQLDPQGLRVAVDGAGLAAVWLLTPVPGGGTIAWPVATRPSLHDPRAVEDALIADGLAWLRDRGIALAQMLLPASESGRAKSLERAGFSRVTTLLIEQHFLDLGAEDIAGPARLDWESAETVSSLVLETTLSRTHIGSQDCPELNGRLPARDVLLGYRSGGAFDPRRWFVGYLAGEPVAILLCNLLEADKWDLAYLGLAPEVRGRGLGREVVLHGLLEAKAAGMLTAQITVDARNVPARALYRRAGFLPVDEKGVWLWLA